MKIFRMIGAALVAVVIAFAFSACEKDGKGVYKDYPQLIVGKWFYFTPEVSLYVEYKEDKTFTSVGYEQGVGWLSTSGPYRIEGDKLIHTFKNDDGSTFEVSEQIEILSDKFICKAGTHSLMPEQGDRVHYRVQNSFDITGKYTYLNSAVRVDAKAGKTEMKLPEGITFGGKNTISIEAMKGDRIVEQMKSFFADAMFTPNAKLRHTVDGTVMYKDYALDGNNLSFELNKGHKLNATSFPDEDGDRLFIIIPKQEAWVGGLADAIRKENPANVLTDEVLAALEKEFMDTFETFTVVLSLSKTGEYNAAEDVDPYKDYAEFIVGKWFNFTPDASMFLNYQADGTKNVVGWDKDHGWIEMNGSYNLEGNQLVELYNVADGSTIKISSKVELTQEKLIHKEGVNSNTSTLNERVHYRIKEQFDISGKYSYLNSAVRVEAAAGKTEMKLPEGITFGGKNTISIEAMKGDRIVEQMKSFFADAMFTPNAKLRHTVDGTVIYKDYALNGNNLSFELNKGHKLNATSFPDEDGDRLFIIIPKQEAWVGGLADAIRKENPANVMTDEVVAALEKEFMDTFETFTVVLSLSKTGEYNAAEDVDPYKDYPQLIVGKWFCFTPEASTYLDYKDDATFGVVGYVQNIGWMQFNGTYVLQGNNLTLTRTDGKVYENKVELSNDQFIFRDVLGFGDNVNYRVKESFDITGKYTYLNSVVRVDAKAGKTEMKLPEGITFGGKNTISIEAMNGDRIVEQMKSFFADAMFTPNAKLRHTVDGTVMYKDYALNGNNLSFELNKGHKLNATSFPDEDGDRLFIIIPKQEAWVGGLADAIRKENPANVLTDKVVAALEKEFMDTFETFTVVLSLSKTGEYNAAEDVDPYKDYPQLIVGKWFNFTLEASVLFNFNADGSCYGVGYDSSLDFWADSRSTYHIEGNVLTQYAPDTPQEELREVSQTIELTEDKFIIMNQEIGNRVHYRAKEQFDIKGNYSYLNSVVRVVPADGKTALQLPEGVLFNGQNYIPVDAMHGDRIIDVMKKFFADATFAADGKLNHTLEGEAKVKNYTLNGNNLVFNLYEGSDTYKVNATSFPDEDGDRLFIIIPKQAAWLGGMVDLVEKENEGLKLNAAQIAALEKEFMDTFETFTVILSLSKK